MLKVGCPDSLETHRCSGQQCLILNDIEANYRSERELAFLKCVARSNWSNPPYGRDEYRPIAQRDEVDAQNEMIRLDLAHPVRLPCDLEPV